MECPKCHTQVADNTTVCPACHKVLALKCPNCSSLSDTPVCSKCGYTILVKCSKCAKITPFEKEFCSSCGFSLKNSLAIQECESDEFASIIINFEALNSIKKILKSRELYSKFLFKLKNLLLSNIKNTECKLISYNNTFVINMNKDLSFATSANKAIRLSLKIINSFVDLNLKVLEELGKNLDLTLTITKKNSDELQDLKTFNSNVKILNLKKGTKKYIKGLQIVLDQYVWDEVHKEYKTDSLYSVDTNGGQVMLYEVLLDSYVLPPKEAESEDIPQAIIQALNKDTEQVISNDSYSFNNFDIKAKCKFSNVSTLDLLNKLEYIEFEKGGKIVSIKSSKENALPTSVIIKDLEEKGLNVLKVNCSEQLNYKPWGVFTEIFKEHFSLSYQNKSAAISELNPEIIKKHKSLVDLIYFKPIKSATPEDARFAYMEYWSKFLSQLKNTVIFIEGLENLDDTSLQTLELYFDKFKNIKPNFIFTCYDESVSLHSKIKKLRQATCYSEFSLKKVSIEDCLTTLKSDATDLIQSFYYEKIKSNFKGSYLYFENAINYLKESNILVDFENKLLIRSEKSIVLPKSLSDLLKARIKNLSKNYEMSLVFAYLGMLGGRLDIKTLETLGIKDVKTIAEQLCLLNIIEYKNNFLFLNNYTVFLPIISNALKKEAKEFLAKSILSSLASSLDDSILSYLMGKISAFKEQYLTLWKNYQFSINTGDYDAYLKNCLKSLSLIEKMTLDIEKEKIEENKKDLYNNILMFLYSYSPEKIYEIENILLIDAINENNNEKIVKLSNLMLQGALISSNYSVALDLLHNILTRLPKPTLIVDGKLNNKFLLLSIIKIEILYNLGDFQQCSEILENILKVLHPETLEKIKPANFSLDSFKSHILDTCRLVATAKLIMLDDLESFFNNVQSSLGVELPEKDCILAIKDYLNDKVYSTGNIEEITPYSKIIFLILQELSTLENNYNKFAQNIYQAKLLSIDINQKELELICDLLIGYAYMKVGVAQKAEIIFNDVLNTAERLLLFNVICIARYLKVKLLINNSEKEKALLIINDSLADIRKNNNNAKIFYAMFEKIYIDIVKDGNLVPCDIEIEEKKLLPYIDSLKKILND